MPIEENQIRLKEHDTKYPEDRRRYPRKKCKMNINYASEGSAGEESIRDISICGIFIETTEKFYVGQVITISIPFSNQDRKIRIKGHVVRVVSDGIGIEFDKNYFDIE